MSRWLVQLEGDRFDLEEFPYWFPDGAVHAIEENGRVYLAGSGFEHFAEASHVYEAALQAVDEFSAVIMLLVPSFQRPEVGHVFYEDENGKRRGFVFLSASISARSKTHATLTRVGGEQDARSPTQAQILLSGSRTENHLQTALLLWADLLRTWPRLYRVLEEIEQCLGQQVNKARLCSDNQRRRFTRSANVAEISGKDTRHALGMFEPPKDPMDLAEATAFIGGLLQAVLARAAGRPPRKT